jgi:hypothetical protein
MFEQAVIVLWRADQDRDLVEGDAATGLFEHPAGDFDRLAPFTRRGEQLEGSVELAARWGRVVEQMPAQVSSDRRN